MKRILVVLILLNIFGCSNNSSKDILLTLDNNNCWVGVPFDEPVEIKLRVKEGFKWVWDRDKSNSDNVRLATSERFERKKLDNWIPGDDQFDIFYIQIMRHRKGYRFKANLIDEKDKIIREFHVTLYCN